MSQGVWPVRAVTSRARVRRADARCLNRPGDGLVLARQRLLAPRPIEAASVVGEPDRGTAAVEANLPTSLRFACESLAGSLRPSLMLRGSSQPGRKRIAITRRYVCGNEA